MTPPPTETADAPTDLDQEGFGVGTLRSLSAKRLWRGDAPKSVRDAWKSDDTAAAWKAWRRWLADRDEPAKPRVLASGKSKPAPLAWGLPESFRSELASTIETLLEASAAAGKGELKSKAKARLAGAAAAWTDTASCEPPTAAFALEAIGWATSLPALARSLDADAWWALVDGLQDLAIEASRAPTPTAHEAEATLVEQLLAGELPLLLSRQLPELRPLHDWACGSREALSAGLERLTDGEGLLSGTLWTDDATSAATALAACWTRCRLLDDSRRGPWTRDAQLQYEWLTRQLLRLADRHGRVALTAAPAEATAACLAEALRLAGDRSDLAAAGLRLRRSVSGVTASADDYEAPASSNHSEWAEVGVLAAGWRDRAPRIVVAHPGDTMRVEVSAGKRTLLAGDWPIDASIAGEPVRPSDGWDCQCWYTDDDGDYLELSIDLQGGARLERQFFLSRDDGVGFLAETLFSEQTESRDLSITSRWPLGAEISFRPERETREGVLSAAGEPVAGVLPLATPEWRDDPRGGELDADAGALRLTRDWKGRNAASVLWIDFSASRFAKQRTWRQLTVAQSLKRVSADVAVGYRIQSGSRQWMIYRSLDAPANRTLLGQNYSSEALVGRFLKTGEVEEYFEIEAEY